MDNPFESIDKRLSNIEHILLNLKNSSEGSRNESETLLTIKEAGEYIKLSVPTIYGLVSKNAIPYSKISKRLYFTKTDLLSWVKQFRKSTVSEISNEAHTYIKKKRRTNGQIKHPNNYG